MTPSESVRTRNRPSRVAALTAAAGLLALQATAVAAPSFTPDDQPTGWVSRPALSSTDLRSGTEVVYRPDFKAGIWTGTVRANHINAAGVAQTTGPWGAAGDTATALASNHWDTGRRIVTRHANGSTVAFRWASLAAAQQALLGTATTGPALLNFVRGDRSNETPSGTKLRKRESVQGDIQHSTLLHWNHGNGVRRLYVGGNDGMLHAFDAATGAEAFAYVPSMLLSRLPRLASNPYTHSLYVDGGLVAADVLLGAGNRTLLAGALGGGGRGLFMLDVTNPAPASESAAATAALVKWEITPTSTGFANLGYSYAAPRLARLNNGVAAVVVGNGYLNTGSGRASLFVINADTGARICEADTGAGSTTSPNGLSTATLVDTNADGKVDFAYAGDIDGSLWRFDLRGATTPACTASKMMTTAPQQAITSAPVVVKHPKGGQLVLFGTGRTLAPSDASDSAVHYAYGYWDGAPAANATWLDQSAAEVVVNGKRLRTVTANQPDWASGGHKGWRLSLVAGERVVGENAFVSDDRFYFVTTNPTITTQYAGEADGANWLMEVNMFSGGSPAAAVFDINGDGRIDMSDNVNGAVVVGDYIGSGVTSQAVLTDLGARGQTLLNRQSDLEPELITDDAGVSGGHFDPDFYFNVAGTLTQLEHHHEYDDTYDVTGVNFLNASDKALNLGSKLPITTAFKVLVMNQYLNPAAQLSVGGSPYTYIKFYGGMVDALNATKMLADQPSYDLSTVKTLVFNLPLDAFKSKDWWRDGGTPRAGLIPTTTGCVNKVNSDGSTPTLGPNGERHNGALTVQIIKADTPATAIELNYNGGGAKYGWRVKAGLVNTWVLAEYTVFWHHPNGKCYGQAGWVPNPPEDFDASGKTSTGDVGSDDPKFGKFGATPSTVTVVSTSTTVNGAITTVLVTYSDGKTHKTVTTINSDGSETVTTTDRAGKVTIKTRGCELCGGKQETVQPSRRINWREVTRQ